MYLTALRINSPKQYINEEQIIENKVEKKKNYEKQ